MTNQEETEDSFVKAVRENRKLSTSDKELLIEIYQRLLKSSERKSK